MRVVFLSLLAACAGGADGNGNGNGAARPDNGFGEGACAGTATTKYWNDAASSWELADDGYRASVEVTFDCDDAGRVTASTVRFYRSSDASFHLVENQSAQTSWGYDDDGRLSVQETRIWNGTDYVPASSAARTVWKYEAGGADATAYEIEFWDDAEGGWHLGHQWIAQWSTRTELSRSGGRIEQAVSKYYDGSDWQLEYETINAQSRRHTYSYDASGTLDTVDAEFWSGSSWYLGWEWLCCISGRLEHEWDAAGQLAATEQLYWDGAAFYVGWELIAALSVRTEYDWA